MKKSSSLTSTSLVLARTASFEGRLSFEGTARLCGHFKGEIISPQALLVIEPGARVEASVQIKELVVHGTFHGEVLAHQGINLMDGSKFYGALSTPGLHVEEGACFEGACVQPSKISFPAMDKKI